MHIAVGSDHAGVALRAAIVQMFQHSGTPHHDFGTFDASPADYPDVARDVARAVASGQFDRGIMICGTGIGASIAANKVRGIRAALCHEPFTARLSREHTDANVLCLGSRVLGTDLALEIVRVWLATPFSAEDRHSRRIGKIAKMDDER